MLARACFRGRHPVFRCLLRSLFMRLWLLFSKAMAVRAMVAWLTASALLGRSKERIRKESKNLT